MDPEGFMYALDKNPVPGNIWAGGENSVPGGCIYTVADMGPVSGGCVWVVNVGLVSGDCMELIGVWTETGNDGPWVDNRITGEGPLIDI